MQATGGPDDINIQQEQQELAELKKVVLGHFSAAPRTVTPFGSTTLSWSVTKPDVPLDIIIKLGVTPVAADGSETVSLLQTTTFDLSATSPHAAVQLSQTTVQVDSSSCQPFNIDAQQVISLIKTNVDGRFSSSDKFSLQGAGTQVTLGDGVANVSVPLTLSVPDWFDADMGIDAKLNISGGTSIIVSASSITANVNWSFFENLASLECGHFIQSGMSQLAQTLIADIIQAEMVPQLLQAANQLLSGNISTAQSNDPQHRTFALSLASLSSSGLTFTLCPK